MPADPPDMVQIPEPVLDDDETAREAPVSVNVMVPMEKFTAPPAQYLSRTGETAYVPVVAHGSVHAVVLKLVQPGWQDKVPV